MHGYDRRYSIEIPLLLIIIIFFLLNSFNVPSTMLGIKYIAVNKADAITALTEVTV